MINRKKSIIYAPLILILGFCLISCQERTQGKKIAEDEQRQKETYTNPILPSGADPFNIFHNGYYYYTHTEGNKIVLRKVKNLANLHEAETKTIWTPYGDSILPSYLGTRGALHRWKVVCIFCC